MKTIEVLIPGKCSMIRGALATCAIEGNQFAIDAIETIRRVDIGEPVGARYAKQLNEFLSGRNSAAECLTASQNVAGSSPVARTKPL
jgi:hypothetical protein